MSKTGSSFSPLALITDSAIRRVAGIKALAAGPMTVQPTALTVPPRLENRGTTPFSSCHF